jgi:M6 family metalloprotease-like protein
MKRLFFLLSTSIILVSWGFTQTTLPVDTLNICAIRVEFVQDDNRLTTGNGKFMIDTVTTDPYAIDPTPHNRLYFQDQIRAAANYFYQVSAGRLNIMGDVFPLAENGAYQLTNEMGYYNPNTTDAEINLGLSQLFTEAIEKAAQDPAIDFSQYDLVVVFHAGVGKDIAFDFDPTPQDIPSLFITHDFLKESLGSGFPGVNTNAGYITQGILLPETQNQQGEKIALKGFFVANIGSYLELYDLFSPSRQRSGIGRFGLMDVGLLNMNGLIPSPPGAFSRQLLGWDEAVVIDRPTTEIEVARLGANVPEKPTLIKIPINDDEYYLIEYRGDFAVNMEELFRDLLEDRTEVPSYLEVLQTHFADQIEIGASGVLLSVPEYDWGLPGAGILIWHIDERIIAEKGPVNRINDDPAQRGVDIEEADGSQDIGQVYSFLQPGYQTELGWLADFWFRNRPDYLEGFELYKNEFSTLTAPNTRANLNNAVSHITLNNFSDNTSDIMTFDYSRDIYKKGFPLSLFETPAEHVSMISGAVQDQANECIFIATDRGEFLPWLTAPALQQGYFMAMIF